MLIAIRIIAGAVFLVAGITVALVPGWAYARLLYRITGVDSEGFLPDGLVGTIALALTAFVCWLLWAVGGLVLYHHL